MSDDLLTRVQTEADQCRNDGADDIARLLDEVAARLATAPAWIKHYAAMGVLDIRGKLYSEQVFSESGLHGAVGKVFRIEAGPETCVTLRDLTPLTMPRAQLDIIDRAADALNDAHLAMPPMSALAAHFNVNKRALKELRAALSVADADRFAAEHDLGDSCCECAQCGKRFTDRGYKAHVSGQECARASTAGMALVPVEPTIEMQVAGFESEAWDALSNAVLAKKGWPYSCRQSAECVSAIWRAMLAAAPGTPSSAPEDELWDQTLQERDRYHEVADSLAQAIAKHLGVEIGEHSSANCPWHRALEALEEAAIQAPEGAQELPPLPATDYRLFYEDDGDEDHGDEGYQEVLDEPGYTAKEMRDYARAAIRAALAEPAPQALPATLTDEMRAVLANEKCVYRSADELYAALLATAPQTKEPTNDR